MTAAGSDGQQPNACSECTNEDNCGDVWHDGDWAWSDGRMWNRDDLTWFDWNQRCPDEDYRVDYDMDTAGAVLLIRHGQPMTGQQPARAKGTS